MRLKGRKIPTVGKYEEESKLLRLKVPPIIGDRGYNRYSEKIYTLEEGCKLHDETDALNIKSEVLEVLRKMVFRLLESDSFERIPEILRT